MFADRQHAGRLLAAKLASYADRENVIVLGLPRGGVPVAFEIAVALRAPLDVFVSRKLGAPGQEELAVGAISSGGIRVLNSEVIRAMGISAQQLDAITHREARELERRERAYRDHWPVPDIAGRIVILVDDGIATGSSMQAAVVGLRQLRPARIVVAVPVAPSSAISYLRSFADEVVSLLTPEHFFGVGQFYEDFSQLTDDEVHDLLVRARELDSRRHAYAEET